MKIYKISQSLNTAWDSYRCAVIVAETEHQARHMHPDGSFSTLSAWRVDTWVALDDLDQVQVQLIGQACADYTIPVVICVDFKEG